MYKNERHKRVVLDDMDPYVLGILGEHKLDIGGVNHKIPSRSNALRILKRRLGKALGLDCSELYFDLQEGVVIDGGTLILYFKSVPDDKVDIKPSEFNAKVRYVVDKLGKELKKKKPYAVKSMT